MNAATVAVRTELSIDQKERQEHDYIRSRVDLSIQLMNALADRVRRYLRIYEAYWHEDRRIPEEIRREAHDALFELSEALVGIYGEDVPAVDTILHAVASGKIKQLREQRNEAIRKRAQEFMDQGFRIPVDRLAAEFGLSRAGVHLILGKRTDRSPVYRKAPVS